MNTTTDSATRIGGKDEEESHLENFPVFFFFSPMVMMFTWSRSLPPSRILPLERAMANMKKNLTPPDSYSVSRWRTLWSDDDTPFSNEDSNHRANRNGSQKSARSLVIDVLLLRLCVGFQACCVYTKRSYLQLLYIENECVCMWGTWGGLQRAIFSRLLLLLLLPSAGLKHTTNRARLWTRGLTNPVRPASVR